MKIQSVPRSKHPASYTIGTGSFRPGRGVDHPPTSSSEVKERVQLYLYSSSGTSWTVLRWTSPFTFYWNVETGSVAVFRLWVQSL